MKKHYVFNTNYIPVLILDARQYTQKATFLLYNIFTSRISNTIFFHILIQIRYFMERMKVFYSTMSLEMREG